MKPILAFINQIVANGDKPWQTVARSLKTDYLQRHKTSNHRR
jgi:hypothetical protein